ncbi:MAG: LEA type 2 family protein [Candidatus Thermoplasmatota archaeon]|nr:LEA type 2 family protein [Candidatus Thermoplasmatota archaeon]
MKKRTMKFILAMVTIINILTATVLFVDIQLFDMPETTISIDVIEISANEMILQATVEVDNTNSFGLHAENLQITTVSPSGDDVANIVIEGGHIPANKMTTFTEIAIITLNGQSPGLLTTKITGKIGVDIGFITKTLPLSINVKTSLEEVVDTLSLPEISITTGFGNITQQQINLTATIDTYNPNTFDILIQNLSANIQTENETIVGTFMAPSGSIPAKNTTTWTGEGWIRTEALNAQQLLINLSGSVGIAIAGFNKSLPLNLRMEIDVPSIKTILSDDPVDVVIRGDYKATFKGILDNIILEVNNPTKLDIELTDIVVTANRIDNGKKVLIAETQLESGIVQAESVGAFKGQMVMPYSKLLSFKTGRVLPDEMEVRVRANVTLPGIDQKIWVGVSGYQDLRLLK